MNNLKYTISEPIMFENNGQTPNQYLFISIENISLSHPYNDEDVFDSANILINVTQT